MDPWSCEDCPANIRKARGNCGGPMIAGKYGIGKNEKGEAGVPMYRVIPSCSNEKWADDFVMTCPIAGLREHWIHEALNIHQIVKEYPGINIRDLVGTPSNQCIEAISAIGSAIGELEASFHRDANKE